MKPIRFSDHVQYIDSFDNDYELLPILTSKYSDNVPEILTCWHLNLWERIKLLFQGKIFVHVLNSEMPVIKLSQDFKHLRDVDHQYSEVIRGMKFLDEAEEPKIQ